MRTVLVGDRYQICRRIGDGGMARVYLAWDTRLRLWCALKIMTAKAVEDEVLRTRFLHEARALARLQHRNLVRFYDLESDVETPYMAMEYLEGGTVAARLALGPLSSRQSAEVAADVASALQEAHDAGIVHRDIKPHNLLLDRTGMVKLSDFGVARVERERRLTHTNMSLGTLAYMPPEQQRDAAHVDHRVDVYALGATLWAMVTGRRPTTLLSGDRARSLKVLPPALEPIVRTATEGDPDRRFQTARAMELALREVLRTMSAEDEVPLVQEPTLVPSTPPVVAELELEPDEFTGTLRPWKGGRSAVVAPTEPGAPPKPSTVRTLHLDEVATQRLTAPRPDGAPEAVETPRLPDSGGWGWGRSAVGLGVLAAGLACAGLSCAGLSCAGLIPIL